MQIWSKIFNLVKQFDLVKKAASFTIPNIALPNGTALIRVLSVSGDKGMQPAQGAVVGPEQGADEHRLPFGDLHLPLPAARPREHLLQPLLLQSVTLRFVTSRVWNFSIFLEVSNSVTKKYQIQYKT